MLIPSIDLMGGKIVQLEQGRKRKLEFDDFDIWVERFRHFPVIQLIDLDAAMGRGDNRRLILHFASRLPCQIGGGIRTLERAQELLQHGARRVILGSSLFCASGANLDFAKALSSAVADDKLIFAIDSRAGRVAVKGWTEETGLSPEEAIEQLEPFCSAFLYTHIDSEGLMKGFPLEIARRLRARTRKRLMVAGGISTQQEIDELSEMGVDAVVGMAIYSGMLKLAAGN